MEFTQDHIAAIIGAKEMEIIGLRLQCSALAQERDALKAKYEPQQDKPILTEVK